MGRGCRGRALPRCSRVAAAHQEPSCSATGRCGRMPSSHHRGPRRSGDIKRGHLQEPRWDVAWLGQTQPGGTFLALPPLPRQLIQEGRRWDTPRSGHKDIATAGCHATTWHWRRVTAGPRGGGRGGVTHGWKGGKRRGGDSSSHPSLAEERTSSKSPNPARPISRERVEGGRQQDQQEECRSCH